MRGRMLSSWVVVLMRRLRGGKRILLLVRSISLSGVDRNGKAGVGRRCAGRVRRWKGC
ncbi:hypothetical protein M3J09_008727 [Ascochyta lentis]